MAPLYKPPTRVSTRQRPWLSMVNQADPDFERHKHRQREQWEGGGFIGVHYFNPQTAGAYNRRSNIYPVGQPFGGLDAAVTNGLAPTVGNPVPGLYKAVDTDGWS